MTSPTESIICWQPDGGSAKRVHVALGDRAPRALRTPRRPLRVRAVPA